MPVLMAPAQRDIAREGDAIRRYPDSKKATQSDFGRKRTALFIHGFTADASYLRELMHQFDGADYATFAFEYECYSGIDRAAESLNDLLSLLDAGQRISGNRMVVVGHSMGGLVARALIALTSGSRFVRKVITLGAPNGGTLQSARLPRYMAYWGEAVGDLNPRGFSLKSASALQLLQADKPTPLIKRLMQVSAANSGVEFYSISGGYNRLDFGKGYCKNFLVNRYLQKRLTSPNDGLVPESSSDLSQATFAACAPGGTHINEYTAYDTTNHTYLVNNHAVALQAIECAQ